ncbi:MAG: glutathione S-transferase N-terminal domain-containing protein, partial [Gammaproteobacteria bacterium]|nr:glutathione S-transferase N-terminal domain-containing protein [Gammaproteobacteria bacterium]
MKFYHFPVSPNSRRALAVACHLGIDMELITVQLPKGEHLKPGFVKLNPNHKIPTLVDDDFVLWESGAIMLYLAGKKPGNDLYPDDPRVQADIHRWLFWNAAHWNPACGIYVFEYLVRKFTDQGDPDQDELKKADEQFHRFAKVL